MMANDNQIQHTSISSALALESAAAGTQTITQCNRITADDLAQQEILSTQSHGKRQQRQKVQFIM
jgi:hypothetical protein